MVDHGWLIGQRVRGQSKCQVIDALQPETVGRQGDVIAHSKVGNRIAGPGGGRANAGARGRPIEPLVLSPQERTYLERQARYRVARSYLSVPRDPAMCGDHLGLVIWDGQTGTQRQRFRPRLV